MGAPIGLVVRRAVVDLPTTAELYQIGALGDGVAVPQRSSPDIRSAKNESIQIGFIVGEGMAIWIAERRVGKVPERIRSGEL